MCVFSCLSTTEDPVDNLLDVLPMPQYFGTKEKKLCLTRCYCKSAHCIWATQGRVFCFCFFLQVLSSQAWDQGMITQRCWKLNGLRLFPAWSPCDDNKTYKSASSSFKLKAFINSTITLKGPIYYSFSLYLLPVSFLLLNVLVTISKISED